MSVVSSSVVLVVCLVRVLWTPFGTFFMWPLVVAVLSGKYFLTAAAVIPVHVLKCPFSMAFIHVEGAGLNAHWCRNCISFCLDVI